MTATAQSALEVTIEWLKQTIKIQPYGEVTVTIMLQDSNIAHIKKTVVQTDKP